VEIDNTQPWRKKHLSALRTNYAKAEFFDEVYPLVQDVYGRDHTRLGDIGVDLIEELCRYLGGTVRVVRSSSLDEVTGDNTERLTQLVRLAGGNVHLTSTFGTDRRYVDWERMRAAGVGIRSQVFEHPVYEQLWEGFVPNLATPDMLCNCGRATAKILEANRRLDLVGQPSTQVAS
ncbi:MAG: hypothetical protein GEV09_26535, partial [Pseudonocardiaceae bacterium]|nr:hypothetical protein [Pseudonocardiaceae bacterium]